MKAKRILHFPGSIHSGGVGSVVMNLYRNIDRTIVNFDFCVNAEGRYPVYDEIEQLGGKVYQIPQIRQVGIISFIKYLIRFLKKEGPFDAVHIHSVHMGCVVLLAAKLAGIDNRIYHVHNSKDAALDSMPFHTIVEFILKIIINLLATKKYACGIKAGRYVYMKSKFEVINNALDLSKFKPCKVESYNLLGSLYTESSIIVGNVARFVKEKNQQYLISLAKYDKEHDNKLIFMLVGDGPLLIDFKKLVESANCEDKFILTGARGDTWDLYNCMDLFILPSLFEGLPVTLLEAQASGLPCLVSNCVTREADVHATKISYFGLENNIEDVVSQIYELSCYRTYDNDSIKKAFLSANYEIKSVANYLQKYYQKL